MSLFSGSQVFLSIFVRIINTRFLFKFRHKTRIWMAVTMWALSCILNIIAYLTNQFWLSIIGTLLVGVGNGIGDGTNYGFMKCFPPIILSGFASGTGMSGIIGSLIYLIFKMLNIEFTPTLITLFLFYPIYILCFYLIVRVKRNIEQQADQIQKVSFSNSILYQYHQFLYSNQMNPNPRTNAKNSAPENDLPSTAAPL